MSSLSRLGGVVLVSSRPDQSKWLLESPGELSCKSFSKQLMRNPSIPHFISLLYYGKLFPPTVGILAWIITHGKVITCDTIERRRPAICLSPCIICKDGSECMNHFFYSDWLFGKGILGSLICVGTNQYIVAFLHERFKFFGGIKKELVLGRSVAMAVFWVIWRREIRDIFRMWGKTKKRERRLGCLWERFDFGHLYGHLYGHCFPQNAEIVHSMLFFRMLLWFRSFEFCFLMLPLRPRLEHFSEQIQWDILFSVIEFV